MRVEKGAEEIVEFANNEEGWPLLHYALSHHREEIAWRALELYPLQVTDLTPRIPLLGSHFGNNASDDYDWIVGHDLGVSALELAVRAGYTELAEALIERGCNPSALRRVTNGGLTNWWEPRGKPIKHELAKYINTHFFRRDFEERSLLFWAIRSGNEDMVELLLKNGADTGRCQWVHRSWRTENPADWKAHELPQYAHTGASEVSKNAIQLAAEQSRSMVRLVLEHQVGGPAPEPLVDAYMSYPRGLPAAFEASDAEAFHLMLSHGAHLTNSLVDRLLESADFVALLPPQRVLERAIEVGRADLVQTHIAYAELQHLERALANGYWDIAHLLVGQGITGWRPLDTAITDGQTSLVAKMLAIGTQPSLAWGGLGKAIPAGDLPMVELLLDAGFTHPNGLFLAIQEQQSGIALLLIERGHLGGIGTMEMAIQKGAIDLFEQLLERSTLSADERLYLERVAIRYGSADALALLSD